MTTKVSHGRASSGARSASSNALKMRSRSATASASVFSPPAGSAHASWPKYDVSTPLATIRLSYPIRSPRSSVNARVSASSATASPMATRTLDWRRRSARIGVAHSLTDKAPVATW